MMEHDNPALGTTDGYCGPTNWANCPACRTLKCDALERIWTKNKWQGWSGLVYCGREFGKKVPGHDGFCGPNNGIPCPECSKILYPPGIDYQQLATHQMLSLWMLSLRMQQMAIKD